jgi:hypothetical protein
MADIESQTEKSVHSSRNLLIPSTAELVLYGLIGVVLIIIYNSSDIMQRLGGNNIEAPEKLKTNFTTLIDSFSNTFSTGLGGRLGQIIVWSVLGAIVYIGIWLIRNVLNSFENDIIADSYLHPSNYSRAGYWGSALSIKVFFAAMVFLTVGYVYIAIKVILPSVASLAGSAAYNFIWPKSVLYIISSVVVITLVLYAGVLFLRIDSRLWKLF